MCPGCHLSLSLKQRVPFPLMSLWVTSPPSLPLSTLGMWLRPETRALCSQPESRIQGAQD